MAYWFEIIELQEQKAPLVYNERFVICQLALELGMSEKQFFEKFDRYERAQIVATYRAQRKIDIVQVLFPDERRRKAKR